MKIFNFLKKKEIDYSSLEFYRNQKVHLSCYPYINGDYHMQNATIVKFAFRKYAGWIFKKDVNWFKVKTDDGRVFTLPCGVIEDLQLSIDKFKSLCEVWDKTAKPGDKGFPLNYKDIIACDIQKREAFLRD